jgi:hypothetical protein
MTPPSCRREKMRGVGCLNANQRRRAGPLGVGARDFHGPWIDIRRRGTQRYHGEPPWYSRARLAASRSVRPEFRIQARPTLKTAEKVPRRPAPGSGRPAPPPRWRWCPLTAEGIAEIAPAAVARDIHQGRGQGLPQRGHATGRGGSPVCEAGTVSCPQIQVAVSLRREKLDLVQLSFSRQPLGAVSGAQPNGRRPLNDLNLTVGHRVEAESPG